MTGHGPGGPAAPRSLSVTGVPGLPEIAAGDDLARLIGDAAPDLADGDILVITSKIVSKAEDRVIRADRDKAIDAETVRGVARRGPARIVEPHHGLVLAAAGVDDSNTAPGTVALLPADPDDSARRIRRGLRERRSINVAVVITDTMGRPWRVGQADAAIGAAGLAPLRDYRGQADTFGQTLEVTVTAVADELASAADLVKGKVASIPVALVRGLGDLVTEDDGPGAQALIRPPAEDMFRYGPGEVLSARRTVRDFTADPVDAEAVRRAIAAALTAPAPHHSTPCRFAVLSSARARTALLDDMLAAWTSDLRGDGFTEEQIARRVRRGEPLRRAPLIIVPCLVADAAHVYPDTRRNAAEREMFVVAMGAAVENLLVALAVEDLGSCWGSSTMFCRPVAAAALGLPAAWEPMGAVGVGHAAAPPAARPPRDPADFMLTLCPRDGAPAASSLRTPVTRRPSRDRDLAAGRHQSHDHERIVMAGGVRGGRRGSRYHGGLRHIRSPGGGTGRRRVRRRGRARRGVCGTPPAGGTSRRTPRAAPGSPWPGRPGRRRPAHRRPAGPAARPGPRWPPGSPAPASSPASGRAGIRGRPGRTA